MLVVVVRVRVRRPVGGGAPVLVLRVLLRVVVMVVVVVVVVLVILLRW